MGISFYSNVTNPTITTSPSPCMCAQMAELWLNAAADNWSDDVKVNLTSEADPKCLWCNGSGIEYVEESDAPYLNLANDNAELLFAALGVTFEPCGDLTIPEARRAVMRARSRRDLTPFTREIEVSYGRPRADKDGVVELRPLRSHGMGVDVERMASYIERFASFVEDAVARGATAITWC